MDPQFWGFIWAFIGTVIGAATSIITTALNNNKSVKLQNNIEVYERREKFSEFQVTNLLELQEALTKAMRIVGLVHLEDLEIYKKSGKWMSENINSELDNSLSESFRNQIVLRERIENEELRSKISQFGDQMADCVFAKEVSLRNQLIGELSDKFYKLMPELGNVLRSYY